MSKRKNPAAVAMGRKGGKKRMEKLTKAERSKLGKAAAKKRWEGKDA